VSFAPVYWIRIADNGTNRIISWSVNGLHFTQVHSVSRTDFITADEVGFFISDSADNKHDPGLTLLSWAEA
jgi:hypothetical protein